MADVRNALRVLHVEDDPLDRELVAETLRAQGVICDMVAVDTREAFARALDSEQFDVILADDRLPTFDGRSALAMAVERAPDLPFIFVSGTLGEEIAVERLKAGATDYVLKQRLTRLGSAVDRALREAEVRREHVRSQQAKLFLEDLITASPSMIFKIDPREFRITYASPNVARLLGYPLQDIVGVRNFWRTLLHQDDLGRAATHLREALEAHTAQVPQEYRFRSADGRYRWFFSLMHVEYDAGSRPSRILWYCIDISERRIAEQALLESEERTRAILRTANDAFVGADAGGHVVEWNRRAESMFGWRREEALGRILADTILSATDRDRYRHEFAGAAETNDASALNRRLEMSALRRDGSTLPVEVTLWTVGDSSQRTVNAFIRDITEQRRAEATVRQAKEEADRANRAKSEFLSRMSHELRTPLNAVLGFAQLLTGEALGEESRDNVQQILKGGQHLLDLVNEVLDISRIEAGHLSLSLEPVGVRDITSHVVRLVEPLAQERQIRIAVDEVDGSRAVVADRQRLRQILLNLLSNAVKYNRPNGRVAVTFASVSAEKFRIKVTDTGGGIRPDKIRLLFSPFERLGAETTAIEGTGLGLALSRGLAEAMGGSIGVESDMNSGSTFWIELTLSPEIAAPIPNAEHDALFQRRPACPGTLLYIEDNVSNVRLMTRVLARRPTVTLLHAPDGESGLAIAREQSPDVIFLDLHLPDLSGEDVLHRLWADPAVRDIPVVMLTADATPSQMRRALASGAAAYLTKPLDLRKVLDTLDQMLQLSEERRATRP